MYANSEGSGETARMRILAWAFADRLCDEYHNLMSWLVSYNRSVLQQIVKHIMHINAEINGKGIEFF